MESFFTAVSVKNKIKDLPSVGLRGNQPIAEGKCANTGSKIDVFW